MAPGLTARLFVAEGTDVYITSRRQDKLEQAVEEIGLNAAGGQADVAKTTDLDHLINLRAQILGGKKQIGRLQSVQYLNGLHFPIPHKLSVRQSRVDASQRSFGKGT